MMNMLFGKFDSSSPIRDGKFLHMRCSGTHSKFDCERWVGRGWQGNREDS